MERAVIKRGVAFRARAVAVHDRHTQAAEASDLAGSRPKMVSRASPGKVLPMVPNYTEWETDEEGKLTPEQTRVEHFGVSSESVSIVEYIHHK